MQGQLGIPVSDITLYKGDKKEIQYYFEHGVRKIGLADKSKPFACLAGKLIAITEEELQAEEARIKKEHLKKQREFLEMTAARAGLTVEAYQVKQEEVRLERQRRIQNQKEQQARKEEEARLEREKQTQKQKEDQARENALYVKGGRRIQKP